MYAFNKIAGDKVILQNSLDIIRIIMTDIVTTVVNIIIIIISIHLMFMVTKVSLWRGLKDVRSSQCKGMQWDSDLPKVNDITLYHHHPDNWHYLYHPQRDARDFRLSKAGWHVYDDEGTSSIVFIIVIIFIIASPLSPSIKLCLIF